MLRIGFIGAGLIAWAHALGLQAMIDAGVIDADIVVVHDPDVHRAAGLAASAGAEAVAGVGEVLDRCDAIWVCTWTAAHREAVEEAAERRCPVFCEKPLATDLASAEALAAAVARSSTPAQVGLVLRSTPVFVALRELVASGDLGEPMAVSFRDDQFFPIEGHYGSTWRADVRAAGGGCLIEHSIHDVDILRFCLGDVTEVAGRTAAHAGFEGVEDVATVALQFASGASASLVSVWHRIRSRSSTRRVELFCQGGMVWFDNDFLGPLHVQTSERTEVRPCRSPEWVEALPLGVDEVGLAIRMYVEADRSFVDAVTSGRPPRPGFDEAVVAHRIVDAAYRSASAHGLTMDIS